MAAGSVFKNKFLIALLGVALPAGAIYVTQCPCGPVAGIRVSGDVVSEPVADWSFANDAGLCQLQVTTWKPHVINLNCMSDQGTLFVSCSNCAGKSWSNHVLEKPVGKIRIDSKVYPVRIARVLEDSELDRAWAARVQKLGVELPAPRPEHWWSFRLQS